MTDTDHRPQLVALDAGTEVRLDEQAGPAPAYVDLTRAEPQRRPIIPEHWATREAAKRHVQLVAARHAHRAAYHGVRSPAYGALATGYAIRGVFVTTGRIIRWWHVPGMGALEHQAAADGLLNDHLRLHKQGRETRKARGIIVATVLVIALMTVIAMMRFASWEAWAVASAVVFTVLARAGRPRGRTITSRAELPAQVQPPNSDVIIRALGALGISEINRSIGAGTFPPLPSPVREDGPGWRAEVDLPYGVTATMVIERREQLASGLRRPLGAVWPEPVTSEHAGRLELWVGRADVSKAKPAPWPWLRTGGGDIFAPFPFGTDPRGRRADGHMIEHNWLLGSMPGQGKTAAVRVLVAAAALDPTVELWLHELKGTGDLDPFEQVSHRFVSGIDDESIGYAAESLKKLKAEVMSRAARLKKLDRVMCPDKKVTREIANRRSLHLHPLLAAFDEVQNLFGHPKYGKQAGEDAVFIIKIGRALGVSLVLATQRPDKDSLPTGVSGNVSTRFCLKVAGQVENDMILGTSAYKSGARATTFRPKIDAGLGYLKGEESTPQVVRTYYLNNDSTDRVAKRARVIREAAGTLSGVALGEDDSTPQRDVLSDVADAFAGDAKLQWGELADRLGRRFPERWTALTGDAISQQCRDLGVRSAQVWDGGNNRMGCTRADVEAARC